VTALYFPPWLEPTPEEWWRDFHARAAAGLGPAQPRSPELQHALDEVGRIFTGDRDHAKHEPRR
jgi:hypothetical protein